MWPSWSGAARRCRRSTRRDSGRSDASRGRWRAPTRGRRRRRWRRSTGPGADTRRPAADLGEPQALGAVEPLHVGRRRGDPERVDDPGAQLPHLGVERRVVDPVRGDELGRDPAVPHRLEHVGVVVRDPVVHDVAVDGDRVVEALVALDELLDGDRVGAPKPPGAPVQLGHRVHPDGALRARSRPRLEDQREADPFGEVDDLVGAVGGRRRGGRDAGLAEAPPSSTACPGTATWSAPRCPGSAASRTCAAAIWCDSIVDSSRSTHIRPCAHSTAAFSWPSSVTLETR